MSVCNDECPFPLLFWFLDGMGGQPKVTDTVGRTLICLKTPSQPRAKVTSDQWHVILPFATLGPFWVWVSDTG